MNLVYILPEISQLSETDAHIPSTSMDIEVMVVGDDLLELVQVY